MFSPSVCTKNFISRISTQLNPTHPMDGPNPRPSIVARLLPTVNTGLLSVVLASVTAQRRPEKVLHIEKCYLVDSQTRNECFFYPLNWKTSWKWAQMHCSENGGDLVSIYSIEVYVHNFYRAIHANAVYIYAIYGSVSV